jgi:L-alanine-DL-glutamate epimerase-like enolase superfamily enzyme
MKIKKIELGKIQIPLKTPFITALRHVDMAEDLIVKITTDDGHTGYGNAPATVVITGDSHESVGAAITNIIGPAILGMDIDERAGILQRIQTAMVHNTSAKAAVDIAVHDLFGQHYGLPLYRLFGGLHTSITSDLTISINEPSIMVQDALQAVRNGYKTLKLKVGIDASIDLQRVTAIRKAVGPHISLRLDANQGWTAKEAIRTIHTMEDAGLQIELIEQPVSSWDIDGLRQVTRHVDTDIMADESAFSPHDVFRLLALRACDFINIKLMKSGGLGPASQIAAMAEACGVRCMMGCMLESKIGITAAASLSAGSPVITLNDLDAADLMAADPVTGGICYDKDKILLPDAPGLGITAVNGITPL